MLIIITYNLYNPKRIYINSIYNKFTKNFIVRNIQKYISQPQIVCSGAGTLHQGSSNQLYDLQTA